MKKDYTLVDEFGLIKNKAIYNTEFKNNAYAVAEVIDNAIDSNAKNVIIYMQNKISYDLNDHNVFELYIINDGEKIEKNKIRSILRLGNHEEEHSGQIGKFGVGFKQALFSFSKRIDVISINNIEKKEVFTTYADPEEMLETKDIQIPEVKSYNDFELFKKSGKLIEIINSWPNKDVNHLTIIKASNFHKKITSHYFVEELKENLGRIFRYFITKSDEFFPFNKNNCKIDIYIRNDSSYEKVKPRDPLFLMSDDSCLLSRYNIPNIVTNQNYKDGVSLFKSRNYPIDDLNIEEHTVKYDRADPETHFHFSYNFAYIDGYELKNSKIYIKIASLREEILNTYGQLGATEIGKEAVLRDGISFIRNGREIDYGDFGLYTIKTQRTQNRFFNYEIHFNNSLDNELGITSNKQKINLSINKKRDKKNTNSSTFSEFIEKLHIQIRKYYDVERNQYTTGQRGSLLKLEKGDTYEKALEYFRKNEGKDENKNSLQTISLLTEECNNNITKNDEAIGQPNISREESKEYQIENQVRQKESFLENNKPEEFGILSDSKIYTIKEFRNNDEIIENIIKNDPELEIKKLYASFEYNAKIYDGLFVIAEIYSKSEKTSNLEIRTFKIPGYNTINRIVIEDENLDIIIKVLEEYKSSKIIKK